MVLGFMEHVVAPVCHIRGTEALSEEGSFRRCIPPTSQTGDMQVNPQAVCQVEKLESPNEDI